MFNSVKYSYDKNPRTNYKEGFFLNSGNIYWEEWQEGYLVFYFKEVSRRDGLIYLYDESRKINVLIPEGGGIAQFKYDNKAWETLYEVKKSAEHKLATGSTVLRPWKDTSSNYWAIMPTDSSFEVIPGLGNLNIKFSLWNKSSDNKFNAYFSGHAIGISVGFSVSLDNKWSDFGSAQKVRPDQLSGLEAEVSSIAASVTVGYNSIGIKLPNVDTSPARIPFGGLIAGASLPFSAYWAGGEFRVLDTLVFIA